MSRRWKQGTSLVTLTLLLAALAAPAIDVCACDVPQGERCCQQVVKSLPQSPSCCASDAAVVGNATPVPRPMNDAVLVAPSCQRQLVHGDMSSGALPTFGESHKNIQAQPIVSTPACEIITHSATLSVPSLRAPPGGRTTPLFLMNVTYRI